MKSCKEFKAKTEVIQQQMVEAKTNEFTNAPKEVKYLFKVFGFTDGLFKGPLAEGCKK